MRNFVERLDVALRIKTEVFGDLPQHVNYRADVDEIKSKIGVYSHLSVTLTDVNGKWVPLGVVHAKDLHKPLLGTVTLRDFCNREEAVLSSVRPATRVKVVAAMEELQFVPNAVARRLSKGKHWVLGLVFTHAPIDDSPLALEEASLLYTDIVIRGVESRAAALGYSLLLRSAGTSRTESMASLMDLTGTVDGLIVLDRILSNTEANILARRLPLVLLAGRGDSTSAMTVRVDNEFAMTSLAEHFVGIHGVKRAGFVSGFDESPDSLARELAFKESMSRLGAIVADHDVLKADWTSGGGAAAMRQRLLSNEALPEVFACANDQMAVGVIHTLGDYGLTVPGDIAVTGFDDITLSRYFNPPLTTIRQSGNVLGEMAVNTLVAYLDGAEPVSQSVVLPTQLVVRRSCGCVQEGELDGESRDSTLRAQGDVNDDRDCSPTWALRRDGLGGDHGELPLAAISCPATRFRP